MKYLASIASIFLTSCAPALNLEERPSSASEQLTSSAYGSCETATGEYVDLGRAMFLENRSLEVRDGALTRVLRLDGETFSIATLQAGTSSSRLHDIDEEIGDGSRRDMDLKFVYLDGSLALYWRETYQHQQYQQGLFRIQGDSILFWCIGIGGITTER